MKLLAIALFCVVAAAQSIDAGGPGDRDFSSNTIVWGPGVAGYSDLGEPPWTTIRYASGVSWSYSIPVENGFWVVDLSLMEPNKTGPNQRRFTVTANGSTSQVLDLFAIAGLRQPYRLRMVAAVNAGILRLDFRPITGNAIVSAIDYRPMALSDLAAGDIVGNSVALRNGLFLDVFIETLDEFIAGGGASVWEAGIILTRGTDGFWHFPEGKLPNPRKAIEIHRNGLMIAGNEWALRPDGVQAPDAVEVFGGQPDDFVVANFYRGAP